MIFSLLVDGSDLVVLVATVGVTVMVIVGVAVGVTMGGTAGTIVAIIEGAIVGVIWWNKQSGEEGDYKIHMIEFCLYSFFAYSNSAYFKPKSGVSPTLYKVHQHYVKVMSEVGLSLKIYIWVSNPCFEFIDPP